MSEKLDVNLQMQSHYAVYELKKHVGKICFNAHVKVYNKDMKLLLESENIKVIIDDNHIYSKISIGWEDIGFTREGFREFKLYGIYSADYCQMNYNNGELEVNVDRIIKIRY